MNEQELVAQIAGIISEMRGGGAETIPADFSEIDLITQGKLDSLDFINLLFRLEESHSVRIPEEDIDSRELTKVKNLARYVMEAKA